jgi:hypothetical protein
VSSKGIYTGPARVGTIRPSQADRQARLMRSGDVGDSLLFSRLQTVGRDAQAVAYLLFALVPLAPLLKSVHATQGCLTSQRLSTKLDALA